MRGVLQVGMLAGGADERVGSGGVDGMLEWNKEERVRGASPSRTGESLTVVGRWVKLERLEYVVR